MLPEKTWVVGGTGGIGTSVTDCLQSHGLPVWASGKGYDVRNTKALEDFCSSTGPREFDGLVYAAGITQLDWVQGIDPHTMAEIYEINVIGLINVLYAAPNVRRVVVVGSDAAWRPMRTSTAYCASKAALHAAVACIARERASDRFAINVVAPGMTDKTGMQHYIDMTVPSIRGWSDDEAREYERSQIPMQRRAKPEEIAEVVFKVLTMETNYLNGAVIPVNGGR